MNLFTELQRRNVFRVGMAYLVAGWLVAQVVQLAADSFGAPGWIMKMLIVALVIGFPAVLFFSWAFELTPEGLKRESEVDRNQSISHHTAKRLNYATMAMVLAAVVVVLADRHYFVTPGDQPLQSQPAATEQPAAQPDADPVSQGQASVGTPASDRSIAVLPFVNMSDDPENEYFADGLAEELLNRLAQLPELRVAGRTSSFQYKGRNEDLRDIAAALNVAHILEGSVRRSGEQVRITAQLIRASDGSHLWSQAYDRTMDDVFAVQDEISENVAANLDVVMDEERRELMRRVGVPDVDAFIAYQRAWKVFLDAHEKPDIVASLRAANELFAEATRLYPGFGDAWYWQTDLHQHILIAETSTLEELEEAQLENDRMLRAAAEHAKTPVQSANSSFTRAIFSNDWSSIRTLLERSLAVQACAGPNWAETLGPFGLEQESFKRQEKYRECTGNMSSVTAIRRWNEALMLTGRIEESLAAVDEAITQLGQSESLSRRRVWSLLALKRWDEAVEEARLIDIDSHTRGSTLAETLAAAGRMDEADAAAKRWLNSGSTDPSSRLTMFAALGQADQANELAARMDARPGGNIILASAVLHCLCGAIWDIDQTPNFKARLQEAQLDWPPARVLEFPSNPF